MDFGTNERFQDIFLYNKFLDYRHCIETHKEFIQKRKENLHTKYQIATQKKENETLNKRMEKEEKLMLIAEECLQHDAALFDEFINHSDKLTIEAFQE